MNIIYKKAGRILTVLNDLAMLEKHPIENCLVKETEYKKNERCPEIDSSWSPLEFGDCFDGVDKHYWIYAKIKTPEKISDHQKIYFDVKTGREGQWASRNPQGLLFLNGKAVQGMDMNHTDVELEFDKEYELCLYFYTGMVGGKFIFEPSIKIIDTKIEQIYYDICVPRESLLCIDEKDDNAVTTAKYLEMACNLLDLRIPYSKEFYDSLDAAINFLKNEYYENKEICGKDSREVSCIGHTHIDIAWLWTISQTEEKAQRSFSTMLKLMDEYDEFKFMSSQPQLYEYVKEFEPDLYEKIKQRVKEGRFEPEGAMWVEADCNLISGESMIRQIMIGKKFFKEEFGVDNKILWLPDVFGYSAAMPQILKKCGVEKFVTSKISWNDTNQLPYDIFMWEGIDGTEIFTTFITAQNYNPQGERYTTYTGDITPSMVKGTRDRLQQKAYTKRSMITFGFGDGGGGSTRKMIEYHRRLKYGIPGIPKTVIETSTEYLTKLEADFIKGTNELRKIPKWVGELYLEFHRGTYTSIGKNKRFNRKSEFLYQTIEQLSVTVNKLSGLDYPKALIDAGWKTILVNQFHDIIPGSSIEQVYIDSDKEYAEIIKTGNQAKETALDAIARGVDKKAGKIVYNPNGFATDGYVEIDGKTAYVENIPALGWKTIESPTYTETVVVNGRVIENKLLKVTFNENGLITSIFDKENNREVVQKDRFCNLIEAFEDLPYEYDNWELSPYYKQKKWEVNELSSLEPIYDGARAGFRIERKFLNSVIIQNIYLYSNSRRIDFETKINWNEKHIVLKAALPVNIHTDKAAYETQFGYIERPTHENTSYDMAKFEVCAHKYADISEDDYGVALLNDCKYGYNTEGNVIKLTLLKAGVYPNEAADICEHIFTYSVFPHAGNHKQGGVIQESYVLNKPVIAFDAKGDGTLNNTFSLVSCDKENVIIDTVKKAENSDATIIRAYDAYNRRTKAEFTFGIDIKKAYLCDMLENKIEELNVENNKVSVDVSTFEIITIMVE